MSYERKVREYYDTAIDCFSKVMGDRWHFGDPDAEARGLSPVEACQILEERLVSLSRLAEGGRALDFGSGVGGPTLHMAKVSDASFVGVTNNDRCTQRARERAIERGLEDRVSFLTLEDTGYKRLPFESESFDAVSFYDSVCHLADKAAFFREAFRVLKRGGRLVGVDWLQRPFAEYQTEQQILHFMQAVNETFFIPEHGTLESYERMMVAAGFNMILCQDLFAGVQCWGNAANDEHPQWIAYVGPNQELFRNAKRALDNARHAGVFTEGIFVAGKPLDSTQVPL